MEKSIFAIGLVLIILLSLPLVNAEAFQIKDLQNGSVNIQAHLVSEGTSFMKTKDFTIKDIVFSINNTKLEGYTFEPTLSYMTDTGYTGIGTMKIENSKDPNVSNITLAHVDFNFDFVNVLKANGMTKYSSSGFGDSAVKGISIGDARWWTSNVKGQLVVLDNGSATLTIEGQP